jgi:hypothetical protein
VGVDSSAFVGESELVVRYRYTPLSRYGIELFVDLEAVGGDAKEVAVAVTPKGFDLVRGPLRWTVAVGEGDKVSRSVELRASGAPLLEATVVTTRGDGGVELSRDTLRFLVAEDIVRECLATDEACKR